MYEKLGVPLPPSPSEYAPLQNFLPELEEWKILTTQRTNWYECGSFAKPMAEGDEGRGYADGGSRFDNGLFFFYLGTTEFKSTKTQDVKHY